jgi:hypothetical protein
MLVPTSVPPASAINVLHMFECCLLRNQAVGVAAAAAAAAYGRCN